MTVRGNTISANGDQMSKTGHFAHRGQTTVWIGETGKNVSPFHTEGLFRPGRAVSVPDFTKTVSAETIMNGSVRGHRLTLPIEDSREFAFTFDQVALLGFWLATANDILPTVNYASDGQTTISSATNKSGTVASATNLAVGDWVEVGTKHATYGGFNEITIITKISGTSVEFEPLSVAPANSSTFKKLAGSGGTGTSTSDTGIIIPDGVIVRHPVVSLLIVDHLTGSRSSIKRWYPEVEVINGSGPDFKGNLATISFTVKPILQAEESFTLQDGTTESRPYYGKLFIDPNES